MVYRSIGYLVHCYWLLPCSNKALWVINWIYFKLELDSVRAFLCNWLCSWLCRQVMGQGGSSLGISSSTSASCRWCSPFGFIEPLPLSLSTFKSETMVPSQNPLSRAGVRFCVWRCLGVVLLMWSCSCLNKEWSGGRTAWPVQQVCRCSDSAQVGAQDSFYWSIYVSTLTHGCDMKDLSPRYKRVKLVPLLQVLQGGPTHQRGIVSEIFEEDPFNIHSN